MKFIALLPMKDNSERIPNKNYRTLLGKPLFYYIADTLKDTGIFEKMVINTDSSIIIKMALERYGDWVTIHKRPVELCGDFVSMNKINGYDVSKIGNGMHFFQTHSTNPFLEKNTICSAIEVYKSVIESKVHDSLFSVNEIKNRLYDKRCAPINHDPGNLLRSQDNESIFEENSNMYIFSYESIKKSKRRIGERPYKFISDSTSFESLDIDNVKDWKLAELLLFQQ